MRIWMGREMEGSEDRDKLTLFVKETQITSSFVKKFEEIFTVTDPNKVGVAFRDGRLSYRSINGYRIEEIERIYLGAGRCRIKDASGLESFITLAHKYKLKLVLECCLQDLTNLPVWFVYNYTTIVRWDVDPIPPTITIKFDDGEGAYVLPLRIFTYTSLETLKSDGLFKGDYLVHDDESVQDIKCTELIGGTE